MGKGGGEGRRSVLLNAIAGLTDNAYCPIHVLHCPGLCAAVISSEPVCVPIFCAASATSLGDGDTTNVNDRSCQSLQQVLVMDGINEIIFEVWAASCKVIKQERSRKEFTPGVLCSPSCKHRINIWSKQRGISFWSEAEPLRHKLYIPCISPSLSLPCAELGVSEAFGAVCSRCCQLLPDTGQKRAGHGQPWGSYGFSAAASRLGLLKVSEEMCCPPFAPCL